MPYWHSCNRLARIFLREVKIILVKVHSNLEVTTKKMMDLKIRKKALAPTRWEKIWKTKCWRVSKPNWMLTYKDTLQKIGILRSYPPKWDLISSSKTYWVSDWKCQWCVNDSVVCRILKGIDFSWFRTLAVRSIKSCTDLEVWFLVRFYKDDTEVSIPTPIEVKERQVCKELHREINEFFLRCPEGMPPSLLLQICRNNLHANIETNMGIVQVHIWKEL